MLVLCAAAQVNKTGTYYDKSENCLNIQFIPAALRPDAGQSLLIHEVSRSHTTRRTTVAKTPLDEWSARRRNLYLRT